MFSSSKKPKFGLDLTINELSNIPQISGTCFIEIEIKDRKKGIRSGLTGLRTHSPSISESSTPTSSKHSLLKSSSGSFSESSSSSSSGNVSVTTSQKKIHNFKCVFKYKLSCNLRFLVKKRENLIDNKYLHLRVYYLHDSASEGSNHHGHSATEIGRLNLNLSEYLNFSEPRTSKYLLKDAKVNSILSLTIALKELPSDYTFHTQLKIDDSAPHLSKTTLSSGSKEETKGKSTKFNVPQFDKKNTFGGLTDVIQPESSRNLPTTSSMSSDESDNKKKRSSNSMKKNGRESKSDPSHDGDTSHNQSTHLNGLEQLPLLQPSVMMDPIVSNLFKKILESTWDPELKSLLEYTPEKCIDDIFEAAQNNDLEGFNKNLEERYHKMEPEDQEDADSKDVNGLINELSFRDDLRSWHMTEKATY